MNKARVRESKKVAYLRAAGFIAALSGALLLSGTTAYAYALNGGGMSNGSVNGGSSGGGSSSGGSSGGTHGGNATSGSSANGGTQSYSDSRDDPGGAHQQSQSGGKTSASGAGDSSTYGGISVQKNGYTYTNNGDGTFHVTDPQGHSWNQDANGNQTTGCNSSACADHEMAGQLIGTTGQGQYATKDEAYNDYAKAVGDYATRSFVERAFDFFSPFGLSNSEPNPDSVQTFSNGTFHTGINLGSFFGGLAGFVVPGLGIPAGFVGGQLYKAAGFHDVMFSPSGPTSPDSPTVKANAQSNGTSANGSQGSGSAGANTSGSTGGGAQSGPSNAGGTKSARDTLIQDAATDANARSNSSGTASNGATTGSTGTKTSSTNATGNTSGTTTSGPGSTQISAPSPRDFLSDSDVGTLASGYYYLGFHASTDPYQIVYQSASHTFTIELLKEPIGSTRAQAEQYLETKLGLSQSDMCRLDYTLGVPQSVNSTYASRNLLFSFCPGAVSLPQ